MSAVHSAQASADVSAAASAVAAPGIAEKSRADYVLSIPLSIRTMSDGFAYFEYLFERQALAEALGQYLTSNFTFDHFVTLTLRDIYVAGVGKVPLGETSLEGAWTFFCRLVRKSLGRRFEFVRTTEFQKRGVPHIHAILVGTVELAGRERLIENACWDVFGKTQIQTYDPKIGAGKYLVKYAVKDSRVKLQVSRGLSRLISCGSGSQATNAHAQPASNKA